MKWRNNWQGIDAENLKNIFFGSFDILISIWKQLASNLRWYCVHFYFLQNEIGFNSEFVDLVDLLHFLRPKKNFFFFWTKSDPNQCKKKFLEKKKGKHGSQIQTWCGTMRVWAGEQGDAVKRACFRSNCGKISSIRYSIIRSTFLLILSFIFHFFGFQSSLVTIKTYLGLCGGWGSISKGF